METNTRALKLHLLLLLLLMPSCSPPVRQESRPSREQKAETQLKPVAGDQSEPYFAEIIDERARAAKLPPLKSKDLSGDDLEFRVWAGFGKKPLGGFVISRAKGEWAGTFLESMNATTKPPYLRQLSSTDSGWEQLWGQVVESGLLTLPDSSQLNAGPDGTSYVVEVKKDDVYRTYTYLNPDFQESKEAKQMLNIASILYTRFGVER